MKKYCKDCEYDSYRGDNSCLYQFRINREIWKFNANRNGECKHYKKRKI